MNEWVGGWIWFGFNFGLFFFNQPGKALEFSCGNLMKNLVQKGNFNKLSDRWHNP